MDEAWQKIDLEHPLTKNTFGLCKYCLHGKSKGTVQGKQDVDSRVFVKPE
jgi:hypothetical protein